MEIKFKVLDHEKDNIRVEIVNFDLFHFLTPENRVILMPSSFTKSMIAERLQKRLLQEAIISYKNEGKGVYIKKRN